MTIQIISIGKASDRAIQELITTYEQRLRPMCTLDWTIIPPAKAHDATAAIADESDRIVRLVKSTDVVVLLDERGQCPTNRQFAERLEAWLGRQGKVVLIIGGAHGVTEAVRQRADFVWSLSKLVFPHQVVRLIVAEQLYRTFAIIHGHPYHHE